jgi:hypothetical protein
MVTSAEVNVTLPKAPTENLSDPQYSIRGQRSDLDGPGGRKTSADKAFEVASATQEKSFRHQDDTSRGGNASAVAVAEGSKNFEVHGPPH